MFHVSFSPVRMDDTHALLAAGDALTINGAVLDLSDLSEGATPPRAAVACDWLASDISRQDGVLHLSLILPLGPEAPRDPQPMTFTADGPVPLPTVIEEDEE